MKTKDFIKMLQEADPSGEAHIRLDDGIPIGVELKDGYWDGFYQYLDEDNNLVSSIRKSKIDIHCLNQYDFVELHTKLDNSTTWEDFKKKLKFDFDGYPDSIQKEKIELILKEYKETFDDYKYNQNQMIQNEINDALKHEKIGWKWFQNKKVDTSEKGKPNMHIFYTWKIYEEDGKLMNGGSNPWHTQGVMLSDKFEKLDNGKKKGYYEWKLK